MRTNQRAEFKNCAIWLGGTIQALATRELAGSSSLWWQLGGVTDYAKCLNCVAVSLSICQACVCLFVPPISLTWDHQKIQHLWSRLMDYRIAGNFRWENFCVNCLLMPPKDAMPLNFARKTFMKSHKTLKFTKVLFLKSFPLYGMCNWISLPSVFLCTRCYTQTFGHWFMLMVGLYSEVLTTCFGGWFDMGFTCIQAPSPLPFLLPKLTIFSTLHVREGRREGGKENLLPNFTTN